MQGFVLSFMLLKHNTKGTQMMDDRKVRYYTKGRTDILRETIGPDLKGVRRTCYFPREGVGSRPPVHYSVSVHVSLV